MADEQWDRRAEQFDARPVRTSVKGLAAGWVVAIVAIVLVGLIGLGFYVLRVATSDVKGRGDAEIIKNEAGNRIRAQEGFEAKFEAIRTADKNLNITAEALLAKPGDLKLSTELNGQKMICNDLVAQYNAKARSFSQQDFRAADLPNQITDTTATSATDCKENSK